MDIPNTGAIFTLGKSHLAENTQSYFYIKNDPIKRLVAGPYQSAVICESGRLFVWGENFYGQLGIGGHTTNNSNNNNNNGNGDIIIKPTCVKSLKTLGLKIADIAFGNNWSVILTVSNEIFFTGRNVFASESPVISNFTEATVNEELCELIRKPFRLEEFDDCLSNNEETENFINVLAGNEHFVLLTSFGRLIGWGSNQSNQLGRSSDEAIIKPHEIVLDSPIQQFACGPESTLVLTESGNLHLTGRLNEFVFPNFTELQKNLSSNEQIIFMHISQASDIFIVTNTGSIYRSYESVRNKSLIFQRFYDYDSEENGPIWKLLKGPSFYAVITKANKFYTTFSESGHHLKTFREISKFKNLRLLDMALGDQHILAHGIPRSSTLASTIGPGGEHRYMTQSLILSNTTGGIMGRMKDVGRTKDNNELDETHMNTENGNMAEEDTSEERPKTNTPVHENDIIKETVKDQVKQQNYVQETDENSSLNNNQDEETQNQEDTISVTTIKENVKNLNESHNSTATVLDYNQNSSNETDDTMVERKSSAESMKSRNSSANSFKKNIENATSSVKSLRPRTPYPESSADSSPQTVFKKTPLRNFSYEAAMNHDFIEHTSPALVESFENIPERVGEESAAMPGLTISMPTPPTEDDEELTVEISETTDPLDHTVTVNEIRFINNGIDVTANVKKFKSDGSEDSLDEAEEAEEKKDESEKEKKFKVRKEAANLIDDLENEIDEKVEMAKASKNEVENAITEKTQSFGDKVEAKFTETKESIGTAAKEAGESVDAKFTGAKESMESAALRAVTGARGAVDAVGENAKKAAKGARESMANMGNSMTNATEKAAKGARESMENMGNSMTNATEKAAKGARQSMENVGNSVSTATGKAVTGARQSMENMGNSMSNATDDARQGIVDMGNNAAKATGDAKDAMGNALRKMAGDTRHAVGAVTSKISTEVIDAKNSISSMLQGKKNKVDVEKSIDEADIENEFPTEPTSKESGGAHSTTTTHSTNTNTDIQEDDERTTASVNSNHTSAGNPFESTNPFDPELDEMVQRGKQALRDELQAAGVAAEHRTDRVVNDVMEEKSKFSKFFGDIREKSKGLSCRNEKSVKIVDDQPPRYSVEDELALQPVNGNANGSKVCTIL